MTLLIRNERGPLVVFEKRIPLSSPIENSSFLEFDFFLGHPVRTVRNHRPVLLGGVRFHNRPGRA
jgi:hypothetical protein